MAYYSPADLAAMQVHFIIGPNRAGTTLLSAILNAHPHIVATPELRFTLQFAQYSQQQPIPAQQFTADLAQYTKGIFKKRNAGGNHWYNLLQFDEQVFQHFDPQQLAQLDYPNLCKTLLLNVQLPNKTYQHTQVLVDKNPNYTFYVAELLRIFPQAKFLIAMRDYRAILLSKQESGSQSRNAIIHAYRTNQYNQEVLRLLETYPQQSLLVPYEQVVQHTRATLEGVCSFLGIGFDEKMLHHQQTTVNTQQIDQNEELRQRDKKIVTDLAKPINDSRLWAWKQKISPTELRIAETICSTHAQQLGYEPLLPPPTAVQRMGVYVKNLPLLLSTAYTFELYVKRYYRLPVALRRRLRQKGG